MSQPLQKWTLRLLWLCLAVVPQLFLVYVDQARVQHQLDEQAGYLFDSVYDRTRLNELLLQNFSTLVASQPSDHQALRRFATSLRTRYPHIVRLQIQERVDRDQRVFFEAGMRNHGYAHFSIRSPRHDSQVSTGEDTLPQQLFPFTFLEPYNSDTRRFLGLDLSQDPDVAEPFRNSIYSRQPVASRPFQLDNGDVAYTLYQAVNQDHRPIQNHQLQVVSLVIRYDGLLPASTNLDSATAVALLSADGEQLVAAGATTSSDWWPVLTDTRQLNRFGQPLQVQLSRVLSWHDFNWILMAGTLLFSIAIYRLLRAYLEQKRESERARERALQDLKREKNRLNKAVEERTQELNEQLYENQRLAHQVMEVQEYERRSLARELHDELGQSLTAIRTDASMLKRLHPNESSAVYQSADSIDAIAQHIYGVTYDMMRSLRPTSLDDLGLIDALRECITNLRVNEHNIQLSTDFSGALNEMSETYNITIYRLVQESLTNTLRHADASQITLSLHRRSDEVGDYLDLSISDNGKGFQIRSYGELDGFGLIGMRERVNALGGRFTIETEPNGGTQVDAVIPLPSAEEEGAADPAIPYPEDEAVPQH